MATTGTLVEWLAAGVKTTAGVAVASGKVRFYQPGTLTPQSVYSDSACTSAISQPITLSAGGTSVVYTNASVRMIAKDSSDTNTLFDVVENVQRDDNTFVTSPSFNSGNEVALSTILDAWATTGGGGSAVNWGYKQSGSATERALKTWMAEDHVSVKDFAAVGDGANNDTTAIQAAITAVGAAGGGVVYLPPGTYLINAALTISSNGVSIVGAGIGSTTIKASGGAQNCFTCTSITGARFEEFNISHSSTSSGIAFSMASCNNVTWNNVAVNLADPTTNIFTGGSVSITGSSSYCRMMSCTFCGAVKINGSVSVSRYFYIDSCYINGLTYDGNMFYAFVNASFINTNPVFNVGITGNTFFFVGNFMGLPTINATTDIGIYYTGNKWQEYAQSFAVGSTVNPQIIGGQARLTASSGGAGTVTVGLPAAPVTATQAFYIYFVNASGGIVTWNLNAVYKLSVISGVISGTNGHTTFIAFQPDVVNGGYRELFRTESVT